jgi:hypothetical protein
VCARVCGLCEDDDDLPGTLNAEGFLDNSRDC